MSGSAPVSYTHLDVYKRQAFKEMQTTTYTLQRLVLATGGDGPSNPWDALGMCISDFI